MKFWILENAKTKKRNYKIDNRFYNFIKIDIVDFYCLERPKKSLSTFIKFFIMDKKIYDVKIKKL